MGYPKNPETTVALNKYYPRGLTELDVWNYYQSVKRDLLKEVRGRDLFFTIVTDKGAVILRKGKTTRFLRLNESNYDELITGRTISIHSTMRRHDDVAIIDIDSDDLRKARICASEVYEFALRKLVFINQAHIRFTGKTSFHIVCNLGKKMKIDAVRFLIKQALTESDLNKKYTIESKRHRGIPNLDLAPNKFRGGFITLHSLSVFGLRCMVVDPNKILGFDPIYAKIK